MISVALSSLAGSHMQMYWTVGRVGQVSSNSTTVCSNSSRPFVRGKTRSAWEFAMAEDMKDVDELFLYGKARGQILARTEGYMS